MAVGDYATKANVKKRLASTDTYSADDDAVLDSLCAGINGWIEHVCQRVLAPIASATYTFDSSAWRDGGRLLIVPNGIRVITSLKVAAGTGQTLQLIPASEYLLLPRTQDLIPGWPATRVRLHNDGGTAPFGSVPSGYGVSELVMATGFDAKPGEIVELAETAVVRAWHGRQAGQADIIGSDEDGAPIVSRFVSSKDRITLEGYRWRAGGGVLAA